MATDAQISDPRLQEVLFHKLHSQLILEAVESSKLAAARIASASSKLMAMSNVSSAFDLICY